jgi:regulatory protein YycI of two-component signal transduction system YycFG
MPDEAETKFVDSIVENTVKNIAKQYKDFMILSIMEMYKYGEIDEEQKDLLLHHNYEVYRGFVEGSR